jgi:predicted cupin superfamily sugar epimerase
MDKLQKIIRDLKLLPHPEGGFYRETYRSGIMIETYQGSSSINWPRSCSTCIYFLLTSEAFSAFHRIRQDEIWHFYDGLPLNLHMINTRGDYSMVTVGRDFDRKEMPQFVISGGTLFAASVQGNDGYSLVGCTVSPGFDFEDFMLPGRDELISEFPQHKEIISGFTRIKPES